MFNGEAFRQDLEKAATYFESHSWEPALASRVNKWADHGAALIDDQNADRATRYLLATIGSLADQNAICTQMTIAVWARRLLVPLWIAATALLWIAFRT
ncbi:MAG: hypothetical protein HY322_14335 [Betaproteobacteria bacterium]|nr:hypothetical protein [Betaproteobacteria bacterium]